MAEPPDDKFFHRAEFAGCVIASLVAAYFHLLYLNYAGALWRDEAGLVGLATVPTLGELWALLNLDASPLLPPLLLRAWAAVASNSDPGFRVLGFLIGIGFLATVWVIPRLVSRRLPVVAMALLAVSVPVIWVGDSMRAYGLGCLFLLVTFGSMWALLEKPSAKTLAVTAVLSMLSVQTLFQNAFLLAAVCLGAWAVCWVRRERRVAAYVLAIALIAALSLLPYLPGVRASQKWWALQRFGFEPEIILRFFWSSMAAPYQWQGLVWAALWIAAMIFGLLAIVRRPQRMDDGKIFAITTLFAGMILFAVFLWLSGLRTQVWHHLSLITLAAVCIDVVLADAWRRFRVGRLLLIGLIALMVFLPLKQANALFHCRQSNVDIVARKLELFAAPDDLLILHPWFFGIPFARNYHGATEWTTVPPITDYRLHRSDLVMEKITEEKPVALVMAKCARTLESGHRVWLVGWFSIPAAPPPEVPRAPNSPWGWLEINYSAGWAGQIAYYLSTNSPQPPQFMAETECVIGPENLSIYVFAGKAISAPVVPDH